jgi:hypothetical protein
LPLSPPHPPCIRMRHALYLWADDRWAAAARKAASPLFLRNPPPVPWSFGAPYWSKTMKLIRKIAALALVFAIATPALAEKGIPAGVGSVVTCGEQKTGDTTIFDLQWRMKNKGNCPVVLPAEDLACLTQMSQAHFKATGDTRFSAWVPIHKTTGNDWYRMPVEIQVKKGGKLFRAWGDAWGKIPTDGRIKVIIVDHKSAGC